MTLNTTARRCAQARQGGGSSGIRGRTLSTPGHAWRSIQQEVIPSAKVLRGNLVALRQAGLELLRCMYTTFVFWPVSRRDLCMSRAFRTFSNPASQTRCHIVSLEAWDNANQVQTRTPDVYENLRMACLSKGICPSDCHAFRTLRPLKRVMTLAQRAYRVVRPSNVDRGGPNRAAEW